MVANWIIDRMEKLFISDSADEHKQFIALLNLYNDADKRFIMNTIESRGHKIRPSWFISDAVGTDDNISTMVRHFEADDRVNHRYFTIAFRDADQATRDNVIAELRNRGHDISRSWFAESIKKHGFDVNGAVSHNIARRRSNINNKAFYLPASVYRSVCEISQISGIKEEDLVVESVSVYMAVLGQRKKIKDI